MNDENYAQGDIDPGPQQHLKDKRAAERSRLRNSADIDMLYKSADMQFNSVVRHSPCSFIWLPRALTPPFGADEDHEAGLCRNDNCKRTAAQDTRVCYHL